MPHSVSARKRVRQNLKRRVKNKSVRSEIKTWVKKLEAAIAGKDTALARKYFLTATKKLDKAARAGVYHRNTIARKKSAIARSLGKLEKAGAGA